MEETLQRDIMTLEPFSSPELKKSRQAQGIDPIPIDQRREWGAGGHLAPGAARAAHDEFHSPSPRGKQRRAASASPTRASRLRHYQNRHHKTKRDICGTCGQMDPHARSLHKPGGPAWRPGGAGPAWQENTYLTNIEGLDPEMLALQDEKEQPYEGFEQPPWMPCSFMLKRSPMARSSRAPKQVRWMHMKVSSVMSGYRP